MQSTPAFKKQRSENDFALIQLLYRQLDLGIIDTSEFLLSLEENGVQPTLSLCHILRSGCITLASVMKAMTFADNSVRDAYSTAQIPRKELMPHPSHSLFPQEPHCITQSLEHKHLQQRPSAQLVFGEGDLGMKTTDSDVATPHQHNDRRICHQASTEYAGTDDSRISADKHTSPVNVVSSSLEYGSARCIDASFDFKNWHGHQRSPTPLCGLSEYKPIWNNALYDETLKQAREDKYRAEGSRSPSIGGNPQSPAPLYGPVRGVDPSFDFNHWHEHRRLSTPPRTGRTERSPFSNMALIDGEEFSSHDKGKQKVNESKSLLRSCFSGSGVNFNGGPMEMQIRPHPRRQKVYEYAIKGGTQASPTKPPCCANDGQILHDDCADDVDPSSQRFSKSNKKRYEYLRSNRASAPKSTCPFGSEDDVCLGTNMIGRPGIDSGNRRRSVFAQVFGGSTLGTHRYNWKTI